MSYEDPEKKKQYDVDYSRHYRATHKKEIRERGSKARWKLKLTVMSHYSGGSPRCAHCGEDDLVVLCIDHVNGGGNKHRSEILGSKGIGGTTMYYWLRNNNFPEGFQVLCWNCNARKAYGGMLYG